MSQHLHDGHRQRMRERVKNGDFKNFQPHEILEYLLFSFIPRKDTNALAHELIKKFGSFNAVLNSDYMRLRDVPGMTENAALFLSSLPVVFRKYLVGLKDPKTGLSGRGVVKEYMCGLCMGLPEEHAFAVGLDVHDNVLDIAEFTSGLSDSVEMRIRDVVDFAMARRASSVIVAHNHPSRVANPSIEDVAFTQNLHYALAMVDIKLLDHFVFSNEESYSFDSSGIMKEISDRTTNLKQGVWKYGQNG